MRSLKNLVLLFFLFIESEIEIFEKKKDNIFKINVVIEDEGFFRAVAQAQNQSNNDPFDKNYIMSVKPRTVPVSGFTSKVLYLGYPVSGAISTNPFPTTLDYGLVFLIGDYDSSGYYFLTNGNLGWRLGTPKQKSPTLITSFGNNLIVGCENGINDQISAQYQDSAYANTVFGNRNIQELGNSAGNSLNTVYGFGNFLKKNDATSEKKFSINNTPGRNMFNTVIGSYNLLSGSAKLPVSQSDIAGKSFFGSVSNGNQTDIVVFGNFNALNVNGGLNTNSSMVILGNANAVGMDSSKNILVFGHRNLISDRADRNDFRKIENSIFIGNDILGKGLETSILSPISECVFINSKKNDVTKPLYDPINFVSNQVSGSVFINAFGPIKKINRSNKTYIGNTKNPLDDDDFDISSGDSAPVVLLSTNDNRVGSLYRNFDSSTYEKNKAGIFNSALEEIKNLKLMSFSKKNTNNSYFFIDISNIDSISFPILSSYLIKDDNKDVIGFEAFYILPLMIEILKKNLSSVTVDDTDGLKLENENINFKGKVNINAKDPSSNNSNDTNSTCFDLSLNGDPLVKGYSSGDLTIGNDARKLHLYGKEIWLIGNGGDFKIGDSTKNSKIVLESGTNDINIGNSSTGNINLGNSTGAVNLNGSLESTSVINLGTESIPFRINTLNIGLNSKLYNGTYLQIGNEKSTIFLNANAASNAGFIYFTFGGGPGEDFSNDNYLGISYSEGSGLGDYDIDKLNISMIGKNKFYINPDLDEISNSEFHLNFENYYLNSFGTKNKVNPNGTNYYMLMLDSNGKFYRSNSAVLANTVSSRKYKENIKKAEVNLEKFKKLLPVIFDYKKEMNSGKKNQWGLIAEDIYDLGLVEAVEFDENGEIYGLNYRTIFMMLLTSYLNSLKNLENLEFENKELKDKVFTFEERLEKIEKFLVV